MAETLRGGHEQLRAEGTVGESEGRPEKLSISDPGRKVHEMRLATPHVFKDYIKEFGFYSLRKRKSGRF